MNLATIATSSHLGPPGDFRAHACRRSFLESSPAVNGSAIIAGFDVEPTSVGHRSAMRVWNPSQPIARNGNWVARAIAERWPTLRAPTSAIVIVIAESTETM